MVYKNLDSSIVKGPYQEVRKGQEQQRPQLASSQEPPKKQANDQKYGAWGSVYKNKQNFINMHCG